MNLNLEILKKHTYRLINLYEARVRPWLEKEKNRRRILVWGSFSAGFFCVVIVFDVLVMPIYLREGLEILVPDLSGKTYQDAYAITKKDHLSLIIDGREYFDDTPAGCIASQRPLPGTLVKPERRIYLIISQGPRTFRVPDLVGMSPRDAELTIIDSGMTLSQKRYRTSKKFPPGVVIDQQPKAHNEAPAKTGVVLYISR